MLATGSLKEDIKYSILEQVEHRANNPPTWKFFFEKAVYGPIVQQ